ncbi:MAG: hypothetical protein AAGE52_06410 [Myxococcota bacterium]
MKARGTPLLLTLLTLLGCKPDLGECNEGEGPGQDREVVYLVNGSPDDGTPLYAGQALMQIHCGNSGFCHSQAARGSGRAGAPRGLDFDVNLACTTADACSSGIEMSIERLSESQREVFDHRVNIWRTIENGSMPPGRAGEAVRAGDQYFREVDSNGAFSNELPSLDDREGRRILRNWLKCGAPVVSQAREPSDGERPGFLCSDDASDMVGDCRVRAGTIEPPEANWASIYEMIVVPLCLECHRDDGNPFFGPDDQELDLCLSDTPASGPCDRDAVLTSLTGMPAFAPSCDGEGDLIVAGDAANSVFFDKLTAGPTCGDPMPLGDNDGLSADILAPIREWINAGAMP